ncbi:hypothetical protein QTP88_020671 [Uroleucon formosanum]
MHKYTRIYDREPFGYKTINKGEFLIEEIGLIDEKLIQEQASFRKVKLCTGHTLNTNQFIKNGFEKKNRTGVASIDLTAVYDTISHRILIDTIYNLTQDKSFKQIIKKNYSNIEDFT